MNWTEDFGDEPGVEDRMPFGMSPEEMRDVLIAASLETCEFCGVEAHFEDLVETGTCEYYTMDVDPNTLACPECLENRRLKFIPKDPSLFDCFTPVEFV